jgi:hypothetical protein
MNGTIPAAEIRSMASVVKLGESSFTNTEKTDGWHPSRSANEARWARSPEGTAAPKKGGVRATDLTKPNVTNPIVASVKGKTIARIIRRPVTAG